MPAEWTPHARCWMAWPCREQTWRGELASARTAYANVARAISQFEPVTMLVRPEDMKIAAELCGAAVQFADMPLDDSWTRDTGPTFVVDDSKVVAACDWRFNAWGGNNADTTHDSAVAARVAALADAEIFEAPFVLEGGAVHVDGAGTAVTTESVLLNKNRNGWTKGEAEAALSDWLGVDRVIWLKGGLDGDETDGHVDNVTCFVAPGHLAAHICDDPNDPNYEVLHGNLEILKTAKDASGNSLTVTTVPLPDPIVEAGERLTASYLNFYLPNGGLVFPAFGGTKDQKAMATVAALFPDRKVVQVDARDIVLGGGGIHCITQQQPLGRADEK